MSRLGDRLRARREVINTWLVELFAAAGDPILVAVARRARSYGARGGTQRLSDWRRGVSSPRQFDDLRPYLLALFDIADKRGADPESYRRQLDDWEMLWTSHSIAAPESDSQECPYRGLLPFRAEDADVFFGREELTKRLYRQITPGAGITMVLGAAGVGKTSLLNAGIGPLATGAGLYLGRRKVSCTMTSMRPGSDPVGELLTGLGVADEIGPDGASATEIIAALEQRESPVVLIVVDQCEDLYTEVNPQDRADYLSILHGLGSWSGAAVVTVLRADFYGRALGDQPFADALEHRSIVVKPVAPEGFPQIIEKPAKVRGVAVATGLSDLIIKDLTAETGNVAPLAMLQLLMRETWEARESSSLTIAAYQRTGGIAGIVSTVAEGAFVRLTPDEQEVARHVFLQLVHLTPDGSVVAIRTPVESLETFDRHDVRATDVADHFLDQRLLVLSNDQIELSHRSLLDSWPRLRDWVCAEREWAPIRRYVEVDAEQWEASGRDPRLLYRDAQLDSTKQWLDHQGTPGPGINEFLETSRHRAKRSHRRRRIAQVSVTLLATIALVAGLLATMKSNDAARALDLANRDATLAEIDRSAMTDPTASARLASEALAKYPFDQSIVARVLATQADGLYQRFPDPAGAAWSVAGNGDVLAFAGADGSIELWRNTSPPTQLAVVPDAHAGYTTTTAFDPRGRGMASTGADGSVRLWRFDDQGGIEGSATVETRGSQATFTVAYSPTQPVLATTDGAGMMTLWDVADDTAPLELSSSPTGGSPARTIAWHPTRPLILTGNDDHTMTLWDVTDPRRPRAQQTIADTSGVHSVAFAPAGTLATSADDSGETQLWSIDGASLTPIGTPLKGPTAAVWSTAFNSNGSELAVSSLDGSIHVWNVSRPENPLLTGVPLRAQGTPIYASRFLDDNSLVSATDSGPLRWQLPDGLVPGAAGQGQQPSCAVEISLCVATFDDGVTVLADTFDPRHPMVTTLLPEQRFSSTALSGDGRLIATIAGRSLALWDLTDRQSPRQIGPTRLLDNRFRNHLAFNPSGTLLATTTTDNAIGTWAVTDQGLVARSDAALAGHWINALAFDPTGDTIAIGGVDGAIAQWHVSADGRLTRTAEQVGDGDVSALTYSADGTALVVGHSDGSLRWWRNGDPTPGGPTESGVGPVLSIARVGGSVAISGGSGVIQLIETEGDLAITDAVIGPSQRGRTRLVAIDDRNLFVVGGSGYAQVVTTDPGIVTNRIRSLT
ncbi:nSTAND1 domain-containing NTPase [Gordonia rubripertincta]|uniref:Novel STAND NTPase 1 domain-containing protein n=1 Tax=Gordonia rubripertincta TaxID=36822 RepID=A0ABT4MRV7_GORRU|nr:hypothetical protein [Gordonia rubripertincta]MCZ4549747.1 hypothetical protein [Gordonia rubripertincta]